MSSFLSFYTTSFHHVSRASLISECALPTSRNQSFSNPFYSRWVLRPNLTAENGPLGIILSERSQIYNSTYCMIPFIMKLMNRQTLTDAGRSQNSDFLGGGRFGEVGVSKGMKEPSGVTEMFYTLTWVVFTWTCICNNSLSCTLQICAL